MMPVLALLAGGRATRLRPLTETIPKSLVRVAGEPFLGRQLRWLANQGVGDVVICCGHLAEPIRRFAGDGERFGMRIRYSEDGELALGTGGAIRRALPLLGERFLVMYGDSLLATSLHTMWSAFCHQQCMGMMAVYRNENRWDTSNVEIFGARVACYAKENRDARLTHIDYGLSAFSAEAFANTSREQAFDLGLVFQKLIMAGQLACHEVRERFYEIGSMDGLRETEAMLLQSQHAAAITGATA